METRLAPWCTVAGLVPVQQLTHPILLDIWSSYPMYHVISPDKIYWVESDFCCFFNTSKYSIALSLTSLSLSSKHLHNEKTQSNGTQRSSADGRYVASTNEGQYTHPSSPNMLVTKSYLSSSTITLSSSSSHDAPNLASDATAATKHTSLLPYTNKVC